jgi:uncharacterized protein (AIM24 family)
MAKLCPSCGIAASDDSRFCQICGAALPVLPPGPPQHPVLPAAPDPADIVTNREVLQVGDISIEVEGGLVPIANVHLGGTYTIYFEHHILLWKQQTVSISVRGRQGMARRFFAGMPILLSEARGTGNIALSRESVGQIVAVTLAPGQAIDVREHQFLLATSDVEYGYVSVGSVATALFTRTGSRTGLFVDRFTGGAESGVVLLHGYGNVFKKVLEPGEILDVEPGAWLWKDSTVQMSATSLVGSGHGGLIGALGNLMAGASISLNRFTGPGAIGIQSMTYTPAEQRESEEYDLSSTGFFGNGGFVGRE